MTVLDTYAVIAYLRAEPAAGEVRPLLEESDVTLTAVGVAEVIDHLVRLAGANEKQVALDLAQLGLLDAIPVDSDPHLLDLCHGESIPTVVLTGSDGTKWTPPA